MQYTQAGKRPHSLDEGDVPKSKKRKRGADEPDSADKKKPTTATPAETTKVVIPKIMPGERMADYSARVDQALPISGLSRKGKKIEGMKERQTRLEKKIQRRIAEWRVDEDKMKDAEEEARDLADLEDAEHETGAEAVAHYEDEDATGKKRKKGRKGGGGSKEDQDDADPWAKLKLSREKPKVYEQAQAPPTFKRLPKETFKMRNGARAEVGDVPRASGSLRRREELGSTRKDIIENYRRMMEEKKAAAR